MSADLYLDVEFNGHGGELISLALAAPDGKHWYGVWFTGSDVNAKFISPWVRENVIHVLGAFTEGAVNIRPGGFMEGDPRTTLHDYLKPRAGATIWADWPDDFAHLMRLMSGPSYDKSWMVECTMRLIETPPGWPKPKIPHNALSDAIALMEWHRAEATP